MSEEPGTARQAPSAATLTEPAPDPGLGKPLNQSADPIDRVVRLAPKWTLFVLGACALLVVAALVWAFAGEITGTLAAPGILKDNGYVAVPATESGQVKEVPVSPGDVVAKGQTLVEMSEGPDLVAPEDGTVAAVYVAAGGVLKAGASAVALTDPDVPDFVFTKLPSSSVGTVTAGMPVEMDVASAPSATYGYLQGTVLEVSSLPLTTAQIATTLGLEQQLVEQSLGTEPGLLAVVGITADPTTPSHYAWTVGTGPDFMLSQGTNVTAKVILSQQAPIQVVFPDAGSNSTSGGLQ